LSVGSATFTTVLSSIAMASAKHIVSRTISFSRWFSPSNSGTSSSFLGTPCWNPERASNLPVRPGLLRGLAIGANGDRDEHDEDRRDPQHRFHDQPTQGLTGRRQELLAVVAHRPDGERSHG